MTHTDCPRDRGGDSLDAVLRAADPAANLRPLRPAQLAHLKDTMMSTNSHQTDLGTAAAAQAPATLAAPNRPHASRSRRRIAIIAGIGGLLAAAAVVTAVVVSAPGASTTLQLPDNSGVMVKCAAPEASFLTPLPLAFAATVTATDDTTATLHVTERFTGEITDTVTVPQGDPELLLDGMPNYFEDGQHYLVAVDDQQRILTCSLTGPDEPELRAVYEEAFPGN